MEQRIRIAMDAMGSDHGPEVLVEGALKAAREGDFDLILVGKQARIRKIMREIGMPERRPRVVNAEQVVGMAENPKKSLRKKDSSLSVAAELVRAGEADAMVSMGNTGASLATTVLKWRVLPGVARPAIAQVIPAPGNPVLLLDVGANVDCKPQHLVDFAIMGSIYAEEIFRRPAPRLGVLSNGEEDEKGNELSKSVFKALKGSRKLNFCGNAEGSDLFSGKFDVIVCDGYVGNVVLKFGEALSRMLIDQLKGEISKNFMSTLAGIALLPQFKSLKKQVAPDEFGGAPLLGVKGVCIIGHGSGGPASVASAIRMAELVTRRRVNDKIVEKIASLDLKAAAVAGAETAA